MLWALIRSSFQNCESTTSRLLQTIRRGSRSSVQDEGLERHTLPCSCASIPPSREGMRGGWRRLIAWLTRAGAFCSDFVSKSLARVCGAVIDRFSLITSMVSFKRDPPMPQIAYADLDWTSSPLKSLPSCPRRPGLQSYGQHLLINRVAPSSYPPPTDTITSTSSTGADKTTKNSRLDVMAIP